MRDSRSMEGMSGGEPAGRCSPPPPIIVTWLGGGLSSVGSSKAYEAFAEKSSDSGAVGGDCPSRACCCTLRGLKLAFSSHALLCFLFPWARATGPARFLGSAFRPTAIPICCLV